MFFILLIFLYLPPRTLLRSLSWLPFHIVCWIIGIASIHT